MSDPDFGEARDFYTFAPETLAKELHEFELLRELGKGSMGIVFEARRRASGEPIALKVLPPSLTLTERALARFLREGRIMSRVEHPDIVQFLDQGRGGRLHWFAMELVRGVTLEERLRVGPLPVRQACEIAAKTGRALQFAHDRGVVHRDIKPGNIMLRDGDLDALRVAVTDFGLARETGTGSMTDSGAIVGTPTYMAPEVILGGAQASGTLADVYALGATLYALVTGCAPFDGATAQSVLKAVTEHAPTPARALRRDLPEPVQAVIEKAMSRDAARRYGSALELAEDLERFLRGERVLARRAGPAERAVRWCARRPLVTGLLAALLVLSLSAAWLVRERHLGEVERELADAERLLALASTRRDAQDRPHTEASRQELLQDAVAAASSVISRDPRVPVAWLVRARAHHRLRQFEQAVRDLDKAERLRGAASPEILQRRIEALRQQGDPASLDRMQRDLAALLELDPSPLTRALVAELLLEFAARAERTERAAALRKVEQILAPVRDDFGRAAVARARLLEMEGAVEASLRAMRAALAQHPGDVFVHAQAAAMFDRQSLTEESARQREFVLGMRSDGDPDAAPPPVNLDDLARFMGEVDRVLRALDAPPQQPPKQPAGAERRDR